MGAKHTPGPWNYDGTWALIKSDCGAEICAVHAAREFRAKPETHKGEALANALLIAASPDLLEALDRVRACLASTTGAIPCDPSNPEFIKYVDDICAAALAKARGNE